MTTKDIKIITSINHLEAGCHYYLRSKATGVVICATVKEHNDLAKTPYFCVPGMVGNLWCDKGNDHALSIYDIAGPLPSFKFPEQGPTVGELSGGTIFIHQGTRHIKIPGSLAWNALEVRTGEVRVLGNSETVERVVKIAPVAL